MRPRHLFVHIAAFILLFGVSGSAVAQAGNFTTIDVPGTSQTYLRGINNAGDVVGFYYDGSRTHNFPPSNNVFTTTNAPGAQNPPAL